MKKLVRMELLKLFAGWKAAVFYSLFALLVLALVIFLRIFASDSSFGSVMETSVSTLSIFAVIAGTVLTLISYSQEVQQKIMKSLLAAPVKRSMILLSKLWAALTVSFLVLVVLWCTSFAAATLLFGFFANGDYSSSADTIIAFKAALVQLITVFFTTVYYSHLILTLFLVTNSLAGSLIGIVILRGLGEMVAKSLLDSDNLVMRHSPLGVLVILNPVTTDQTPVSYSLQLAMLLIYSLALFYLNWQLFENKDF